MIDPYDYPVDGYCPACGSNALYLASGRVTCFQKGCPDPDTATKILDDPEIHHVVRFDEHTFNAQHPLRERVDGALLDCDIHEEINRWVQWQLSVGNPRQFIGGTWRIRPADEHDLDANWVWEPIR